MLIRIAGIGDSHLSERKRLDDNVAVHRAFLEQAREAKVDLIVHGGDFFDARSTPAERNALDEFLHEAAEIAPVFGVKGNHDVDDDLAIFNRLATKNPIMILERPDILVSYGFALVGIPWFTKAHVVAQLPADTPAAQSTEMVIRTARGLLNAMRHHMDSAVKRGNVPIFVGHVQVAGCEVSTGQVLIGQSVELSPSDILEVGAAYAHLSHIHKAQSWFDGRVSYPGSPQRGDFGETEAKGWNLVSIDTERWREQDGVTVEFRELPARRIVLDEYDWTEKSAALWISREEVKGALVRVRCRLLAENLHLLDEEAIRAEYLAAGAHEVKIEAVLEHTDRVRAAAIVEARDTRAKLGAYWQAAGIDVPTATRERIWAKLDEIERRQRGEVAHAAA